jgi:Flp pilus assembly protein TadD
LAKLESARLLQRAKAQFQAGAHDDACAAARRALDLDHTSADAHHMLGAIAFTRSDWPEAQAQFAEAIRLKRDSPHLHYHLANVLRARGQHKAAESTYRQALQLAPDFAVAHFGLGLAFRAMDRPDEAAVHLRRYLARVPEDAEAHHQLGLALRDLGKLDQAIEHLEQALAAKPGDRDVAVGLATTILLAGDFCRGWRIWLQCFARTMVRYPDPADAIAAFAGKHVVIHANEGVGDEVMYASCLPDLEAVARDVTLYCDRRLATLFQRSFPAIRILGTDKEATQQVVGRVSPDEIHLLASQLPAYFRRDVASFPSRRCYLVADVREVDEWRRRFEALGDGPKVGLSWRGGADPVVRARRSIPLADWGPLLAIPGVSFINLQYGEVGDEVRKVEKRCSVPIHSWSDANPITDLDSFAAQVAALDLVISVDNSTVHIAGSLGVPVWVLLPRIPDWRWTMAGSDSYWYPSAKLIRQGQGENWGNVVRRVRSALQEYARPEASS